MDISAITDVYFNESRRRRKAKGITTSLICGQQVYSINVSELGEIMWIIELQNGDLQIRQRALIQRVLIYGCKGRMPCSCCLRDHGGCSLIYRRHRIQICPDLSKIPERGGEHATHIKAVIQNRLSPSHPLPEPPNPCTTPGIKSPMMMR